MTLLLERGYFTFEETFSETNQIPKKSLLKPRLELYWNNCYACNWQELEGFVLSILPVKSSKRV